MTSSTAPTPSRGFAAATLGALLGLVVLGGIGVAIGVGLMELFHDPEAGLANLGLLIFPLALGGAGTIGGIVLGTRAGLRRAGHPLASETAALTLPLTVAALALTPAWGVGLLLLPGVAAASRWLTLRRHAPR